MSRVSRPSEVQFGTVSRDSATLPTASDASAPSPPLRCAPLSSEATLVSGAVSSRPLTAQSRASGRRRIPTTPSLPVSSPVALSPSEVATRPPVMVLSAVLSCSPSSRVSVSRSAKCSPAAPRLRVLSLSVTSSPCKKTTTTNRDDDYTDFIFDFPPSPLNSNTQNQHYFNGLPGQARPFVFSTASNNHKNLAEAFNFSHSHRAGVPCTIRRKNLRGQTGRVLA